jgi:hypothetical protein
MIFLQMHINYLKFYYFVTLTFVIKSNLKSLVQFVIVDVYDSYFWNSFEDPKTT